jgi:hypothetical protein
MPDAEPVEAGELGNEKIRKLENAGRRACPIAIGRSGRMAGLSAYTPRSVAKYLYGVAVSSCRRLCPTYSY